MGSSRAPFAASSYRDGAAIFEAWVEVIRTRDEKMEQTQRDCPMQREVSRREFFARLGASED